MDIEDKEDDKVDIYHETGNLDVSIHSGAAHELVSCIRTSIDVNDLPDSMTLIVDELNDFYNKSNNYFAFKYKDIYTGFTIS